MVGASYFCSPVASADSTVRRKQGREVTSFFGAAGENPDSPLGPSDTILSLLLGRGGSLGSPRGLH